MTPSTYYRLTVSLANDDHEKLTRIAESGDRSLSSAMRQLIRSAPEPSSADEQRERIARLQDEAAQNIARLQAETALGNPDEKDKGRYPVSSPIGDQPMALLEPVPRWLARHREAAAKDRARRT